VKGLLLDTNALLRLELDSASFSSSAREALLKAERYVSVVSAAEIAIKASIGKLPLPEPFSVDFTGAFQNLLDRSMITLLPLDLPVIAQLRHLPLHHRDPFDRLIIAQAFAAGLTVVTSDRAFAAYAGLEILEI